MTRTLEQRAVIAEYRAMMAAERKAAKASRPKSPKASRGRELDRGFLAYLRRQPCAARGLGHCSGPIEAAHIRYGDAARGSINPGMQRKNHDRFCNPLCNHHHQHVQHQMNERSFWQLVGIDAYTSADLYYNLYLGESK